MPHFAVVIKDPDLAQAKEIERNVQANVKALPSSVKGKERTRAYHRIDEQVRHFVGPKKQVGDLHTTAKVECPDGEPNCRNCGDPAFTAQCTAAGHCEYCGTRHGIAPDSHVAASGYELVELPGPPQQGQSWDRSQKRFR